jgi:hypothetical protein
MSKQSDIENYYFAGYTLTVLTAREIFHTTELRRINSRINHKLAIAGNLRIVGDFLVNKATNQYDDFKTYRLVHTKPNEAVIVPVDIEALYLKVCEQYRKYPDSKQREAVKEQKEELERRFPKLKGKE